MDSTGGVSAGLDAAAVLVYTCLVAGAVAALLCLFAYQAVWWRWRAAGCRRGAAGAADRRRERIAGLAAGLRELDSRAGLAVRGAERRGDDAEVSRLDKEERRRAEAASWLTAEQAQAQATTLAGAAAKDSFDEAEVRLMTLGMQRFSYDTALRGRRIAELGAAQSGFRDRADAAMSNFSTQLQQRLRQMDASVNDFNNSLTTLSAASLVDRQALSNLRVDATAVRVGLSNLSSGWASAGCSDTLSAAREELRVANSNLEGLLAALPDAITEVPPALPTPT